MKSKYKIFIIFHNTLNIKYYNESVLDNFVFVNVKKGNLNNYPKLNVINLHEFHNFIPLGSYYAESEVLYNIFINKYLIEDVEYVGFLHHDIDCSPLTNEVIEKLITNEKLVSFETHKFKNDYDQNILMDPNKPNLIYGKKGRNCYDTIFSDFNSFYGTRHSISLFSAKENEIVLCSCFLLQIEVFFEMMAFSSKIIESKKLDLFDTKHTHRIQGGLMERYYATWFLLNGIPLKSFYLKHNFHETNKQNTLINRIFRKIQNL